MKAKTLTMIAAISLLALGQSALASSTWYVNGVSGSDSNNCQSPTTACKTIGHATSLAVSGDSILVAAATYKENLTIALNLTILGSSAQTTIIDGGNVNTVVTISNSAARVTLTRLTIRHGSARYGGGIYSSGALTINQCVISGNTAKNSGRASGGGIYTVGALSIHTSTISGNSAAQGTGISYYPGHGGSHPTFQNSIVANNIGGGNCSGPMTSHGYNMSSDSTCTFSNSGDRNNINPLLGPLQNNGGPTQTMALPSGSPAVDAGNPSGCTDGSGHLLTTDQRGYPRHDPEDTRGCDMGAYERQTD